MGQDSDNKQDCILQMLINVTSINKMLQTTYKTLVYTTKLNKHFVQAPKHEG